jgi:hypothetical protein
MLSIIRFLAVNRYGNLSSALTIGRAASGQCRPVRGWEDGSYRATYGGRCLHFNNLLTAVVGTLDPLRCAPEERRGRLIDNALQALAQGSRIGQQRLAFSRGRGLMAEVGTCDLPVTVINNVAHVIAGHWLDCLTAALASALSLPSTRRLSWMCVSTISP